MSNRLARERSPYLLQHADNPVDWFPWGDAAFDEARRSDRPIFLSVGYSTCHWCHVMAHESFEDAGIAAILNRDFVSIKLDREERPDVDRVYMTFVQATTGAGGWPMSVWLTPDLKPFFGGTYFPPSTRWGRPGFAEVLAEVARMWRQDRPRILSSAETIVTRLRDATGGGDGTGELAPVAEASALVEGIASFAESFDRRNGGFGGAPKFPRPSELRFLLAASAFTGDEAARQMTLDTLRAMAMGGMRDHVGGGFHRYSVDAEWRVPHFEKMLYDQAQIALACLEATQASGDPFYAAVAEDTLGYVVRELRAPEGGFFSAEDADSLPAESGHVASHGSDEGHAGAREGAFYVWTVAEIDRLLGADAAIVTRRFGVEEGGNAPSDPQGEFRGQNILYIAQSIEDIAVRSQQQVADVMRVLTRARKTLFDARETRPRPHLDDKVLTAWNGLMIAAFARAARLLVDSPRRAEWLAAATDAAAFVRDRLWQGESSRLLRRFRDGDAAIPGFCEDYAYLTWGVLELFQTTGDVAWLDWAIALVEAQSTLFFDRGDGGWFSTTGEDASVLLRLKEDYDGAEPSAASVTVQNLLVLAHLVNEPRYYELAERTLARFGPDLGRGVRVMPFMVANLAAWHHDPAQCVIVGPADDSATLALERAAAARFVPWMVSIRVVPGPAQAALGVRLPWLAAMTPGASTAAAYVCEAFTCQAPVSDAGELERFLAESAQPRRVI
jgi:uncharacterized protein YyaL (SSP411 family)